MQKLWLQDVDAGWADHEGGSVHSSAVDQFHTETANKMPTILLIYTVYSNLPCVLAKQN
jgi:hypothetical protein